MGYNAAALYCLGEKTNLEEALTWAQAAISTPFIGQENFTTLSTLSQLQAANGLEADASSTLDRATRHPTATPGQIHGIGRQMIGRGRAEEAMKIYELNAELNPGAWPVNLGMARGLSALGKYDEAIPYAEAAHKNAPDDLNRNNIENLLEYLKEGKDIN
jgi:tetratricopeptide (TPR) repeat protein